jgi:hypothetical protein
MEKKKTICKNPWCKGTFFYSENDMIVSNVGNEVQKSAPTQCNKCKSFDTELSGGVEWVDKEYEGDRFDGSSHQFKYKVTNFKL